MASYAPNRVCRCVWKYIIVSLFVLDGQRTVAENATTTQQLVQQDWGCDHVLYLTELASKPGLKCTDFVNTFNFGELDPASRPGIEVNFHNELFKNHTVPTPEELPYGYAQVNTANWSRSDFKDARAGEFA